MRVRFWGTRGSIPTPGHTTLRYGGNTSCVEVRSDSGTLLVLDCGTGARPLGEHLLAESARAGAPAGGAILVGHTHWDHIQGLPFFAPLFQPGGRWAVYGPRGLGGSMAQTLAGQMQYQYFPVSFDQLGAEVTFHDLVEGRFEIGDVVIRTRYLNHPALTLGYRIEADGVVVAYLTDHEPYDPGLAAGGAPAPGTEDGRHAEFLSGADLVIHDAQYLAAEYAAKRGWGHSTVEHVVDTAIAGGVRRLALFHHDPTRTDDEVDALLAAARARSAASAGPAVAAAAEGDELVVEPRSEAPAAALVDALAGVLASTAPALEDLDVTVVVATADPELTDAVVKAASAEQLRIQISDPDGLRAGGGYQFDAGGRAIVVTDLVDPADARVGDPLGGLSADPSSRIAVLAITRKLPALTGAAAAVSDWVVWPATPTHLRTKLRATVLRRACRWLAAPVPADEERRLQALRDLRLLDTAPEERFDRLTEQARQVLGVPVALVSLVDDDRQWFKSRRGGGGATESPRDQSLCAHAILGSDVLQVPDLLEDDRFADNPAVVGGDHARFYAGAPLVMPDGSRIGTLCVVDSRPRLFDEAQLDQLRTLAREVEAELQRRE